MWGQFDLKVHRPWDSFANLRFELHFEFDFFLPVGEIIQSLVNKCKKFLRAESSPTLDALGDALLRKLRLELEGLVLCFLFFIATAFFCLGARKVFMFYSLLKSDDWAGIRGLNQEGSIPGMGFVYVGPKTESLIV